MIRQGGTPEEQGTWIHPDLAIAFGTWLSVEFEYQLTQWVKEWENSQRPHHPGLTTGPSCSRVLA